MRRSILLVALVALATACAQSGGEPVGGTIEVTGSDYEFAGVPALVAPGAEFTFTNASDVEVHEMVVVKVIDGETRTLQEILELPDRGESLIEFQGVLFAKPGEDGVNLDTSAGSNTITVSEAGRYAVVCFIPQGADPAAVEAAMSAGGEGPPDLGGGTPHALLGMTAEFTIEG